MQKIKSPALKGIQIHHQREKESRTNPDIQEERSHENYDLVHSGDIEFHQRVKEIIESQKIGTRKTRKDAVLVNELLITSDEHFFKQLSVSERERFFEESYRIFAERYGVQNVAYARVHLDEKTPHMHLGIVPMRDGRLQSKNVFNRQELQWIIICSNDKDIQEVIDDHELEVVSRDEQQNIKLVQNTLKDFCYYVCLHKITTSSKVRKVLKAFQKEKLHELDALLSTIEF